MINNWELTSRIDHNTGNIHYAVVTDGTEHDARLIAKKLKGFVQQITPAQAPYVYTFELPIDLDEGTQDKIRTAVTEAVELTNKINEFVPGGVLGDPLFNADTNREDKDFPTLTTQDPSASQFNGEKPPKQRTIDLDSQPNLSEPNIQAHQVKMGENLEQTVAREISSLDSELSTTAREVFSAQQPQNTLTVANAKGTKEDLNPISITDNDMLIKDMEGSVLQKMPLEDILSAETRYDMFVDVDKTPQQAQQLQEQKNNKIASAQPQAFNVFEQDLKEETNVLDVEEVREITDRLPQKEMPLTSAPSKPNESGLPPQPAETEASSTVPFTLGASEETDSSVLAGASHEELPEEEVLEATLPPTPKDAPADGLPEIAVRGEEELDKTFNLETTFNTELFKRQYEKTHAMQETNLENEKPHTKTILRLKKQTPEKPAAPQEAALGKTTLRLRRKPAGPQPNPQTLRGTKTPQRSEAENRGTKTKNIDHSIQIPGSELKKHNWPLEVPLIPTYTLSNMIMSVNRFAHATAISVIENPGKLYNPLVLHGGTGTGKTHFLNALAYAFSQKFGQEHIFMTNGVRLSRGIQRYVMEGNIEKFENFMASVRVLLIDDIHLLAINEQNRAYISKLLNTFVKEQKQIVITSKYPPESLEKLEELINFRLDSGWISELKPATGSTHFRIVKKMLIENHVDLSDSQIESFFSAPHMTLGTVTRSVRRLKVLENLIFPNVPKDQYSQADIFEKLLATKGEDPASALLNKDPMDISSISTVGNGEWGRIGFFYPQNCSEMMNWMVYALQQRAKELKIEGGFDIVVRSSYATENIISSAFKIANLCDNKKLKGAVILGPMPNTCDLSVRENFYDILTHMLEIMLIRCGIINYEDVRLPSTYVKVISELMR